MSTPVGNHGLTCLDDTDYAHFALAMQCNANAVDATLTSQGASLDTFLARQWLHRVNTASVNLPDTTGVGTVGPGGVVGTEGPSGLTTSNGLSPFSSAPPGLYLIGASINWTLVTPTANSFRELFVFGVLDNGGPEDYETDTVDLFSARDYQGDGGNNGALDVWGLLDTRGRQLSSVRSFFTHSNTASVLVAAAGQWRLSIMYLGSGLTI